MGASVEAGISDRLLNPVAAAQVVIAFTTMSDEPEQPVEAAAIHGLSEQFYEAGKLFDHAVELIRSGKAERLAVVGGDGRKTGGTVPGEAWIGSEAVIDELASRGVSRREVILMNPITHSKEEALAIVNMAKDYGFRRVGSISVAYHGGRMFPYMVAAMKEIDYWVEYFTLAARRTNWWTPVLGSQGAKVLTCAEAILDDAFKIEAHIKRGFAAPFAEVVYYLKNRTLIARSQNFDYPGLES